MDRRTSSEPLIGAYDGVVCDLDGVVYRGADAVPGAADALQAVVARGVKVVYATNNASRVPAQVAAQLGGIGAPATPADVVTSAQAGAARLARELTAGARVLALGGDGVVEALEDAGLSPVVLGDEADAGPPGVAAVLQGLGRQLRVRDFDRAAEVLTSGVAWVATNDDATLPMPWGQAPGNGAYIDLLAAALRRRPEVVGKPHPPLYDLAMERLDTPAARTLAVGDRIVTDIVGAERTGIDSAWVLTGVDRPSDLVASGSSPTYVLAALGDLLSPYAVPLRDGAVWRCGGARVRLEGEELTVEQASTTPVETVRAGLAALLAQRDRGVRREHLVEAARVIDGLVHD
jgi:HAD superfamily hydrolase (TIGR01450 family)